MIEPHPSRMTVRTDGVATVRQRPSLLLMKHRLRAAESTLELGLARLKAQREAASQWLKRLEAVRVEFGEPHFDDQTDKDPLTKLRTATIKGLGKRLAAGAADDRRGGVNVVLTAVWDISAMSAEQTLLLLDRLRFEAAEDAGPAESAEEPPGWNTPEEQMREIFTQLHQPPPDDRAPQFLFVARLSDEQMEKAEAESFARARRNAERLARAAGLSLGKLESLYCGAGGLRESRPNRMMERQRCEALLAGSTYELGEQESVSDDLRSAEFTITVNVSYLLE
jgi:hypothetical protein